MNIFRWLRYCLSDALCHQMLYVDKPGARLSYRCTKRIGHLGKHLEPFTGKRWW